MDFKRPGLANNLEGERDCALVKGGSPFWFSIFLMPMFLSLQACNGSQVANGSHAVPSAHVGGSSGRAGASKDGEKGGGKESGSSSGKNDDQREGVIGSEYYLKVPQLGFEEAVKRYMPKRKGKSAEKSWSDYSQAADVATHADDYSSAELLLSKAIELDPKNAHLYYKRGRAKYNSLDQKSDGALLDFERAIELGERDSDAFEHLGELYYTKKEFQKALDVLSRGINESNDPRKLYRSRAPIYLSIGDKEKALSDYDTALKETPTFTRGYIMRAQLYESLGRNEEALEDYKNVAKYEREGERMDKKSVAVKLRASLLDKLGRHKEAVEVLTEGLELFQKDDELLRLRGEQFLKLKDYDKAVSDFSRSIKEEPHYAGAALEARSRAYDLMGKKNLAEADRKAALELKDRPAEKPVY